MRLTVLQVNERLASKINYITPVDALLWAAKLSSLAGGVAQTYELTLPEGFYVLTPPSPDHHFFCYQFNNGLIASAGPLIHRLTSQPKWLWNIPLIGVMWKLKKEYTFAENAVQQSRQTTNLPS